MALNTLNHGDTTMTERTYILTEDGYRFILNDDGSYQDEYGDISGDSLDELDVEWSLLVARDELPDDISKRDSFHFLATREHGCDFPALYFVVNDGGCYEVSPLYYGSDTIGTLLPPCFHGNEDDDGVVSDGCVYVGRCYDGLEPTMRDFIRMINDGAC